MTGTARATRFAYELDPAAHVYSETAVGEAVYATIVLENTGKAASAGGVYGMIIDSTGRLYTSSYTRNYLPCFDTVSEEWIGIFQRDGGCSYGITVDGKDRIWTGSWPAFKAVNADP